LLFGLTRVTSSFTVRFFYFTPPAIVPVTSTFMCSPRAAGFSGTQLYACPLAQGLTACQLGAQLFTPTTHGLPTTTPINILNPLLITGIAASDCDFSGSNVGGLRSCQANDTLTLNLDNWIPGVFASANRVALAAASGRN
jgi:hypothetical protein